MLVLGSLAPHAMQNAGEPACDGDARPDHSANFGDLHAPGPQARPFAAAHKQRMRRLIESRAGEFVPTSADFALNFRFTRLITCRCYAKVCAYLP